MINSMEKFLIGPSCSLSSAMRMLNEVSGKGLVVVNEKKELLGTVTDGDIRRALIRGATLNSHVKEVMHPDPLTALPLTSQQELEHLSDAEWIRIIPIVNKNNIVVDLYHREVDDFSDIPVVLMAGGLGTRLGDQTKNCPKPMLEVGGQPILERVIEGFTKVGFKKFFISVNYKAEVIENYFGNGQNHNCSISYLREKIRLGTAGSLSLLPVSISGPIVVMNGDVLTKVDFRRLVNFYHNNKSSITMCVKEYQFKVPYGVIGFENGQACSFDEKPMHSFNVNAGVYVLDSKLLKYVPKNKCFDMSLFLNLLLEKNIKADCFPVVERWTDVGRRDDLNDARRDYAQ